MARDYSSRQNGEPPKNGRARTNRRTTPAARPNKPKKPQKKTGTRVGTSAPGWVWGLSGLFVGIVLVSGYYIFARPAGTPGATAEVNIPVPQESAPASAEAPADTNTASPTAPNEPEEKPRFSFYKLLPNYQVDVSEGAHKNAAESSTHEPHEPEPSTPSRRSKPEPAPSRPAPANNGQTYVIQAGAFSSADDAERRKAELALLGVTAGVSSVTNSAGKTIYRVQSSPVASAGKAQELTQRLKSNGIETMIRKAN